MTTAVLWRAVQLVAFAFAALGAYVPDFAPPGASALVIVLTSVLALCAFGLVSFAAKPSPRVRRIWLYVAVGGAVAGAVFGLWYRSAYDESVFVYQIDGSAHLAGGELTPNGERLVDQGPEYETPNGKLLAALGRDTEVWTAASIARVRLELTVLFLAFVVSLAAAVFATAERLRTLAGARLEPSPADAGPVILFLAANPRGTSELELVKECAAIERELQLSAAGRQFDFRSKWAVGVDDVLRHLNDLKPTIVHFSGHGTGTGSSGVAIPDTRDVVRPTAATGAALVLQDEQDGPQYVEAGALATMIRSAAPSVRLVVLDACYSDELGESLREVIECVVGMRGAVGDVAARAFAVGFYRALGYRASVANAVEQGIATLAGKQLHDAVPVCRARDGLDPGAIMLLPPAPAAAA